MRQAAGIHCRLCGGEQAEVVLEPLPFRLSRCRQCGLVRTEGGEGVTYDATYYSAHALADTIKELKSGADPRSRLMDRAYATYLDPQSSLLRRLSLIPVRNRLGGLPPRTLMGRDLLDVGSGDGDFLRRARASGYRVTGQEINADAVASARAAGLDVRLGELGELGLAPASFDCIRLWHVLEHVPDPLAILRIARPLLRPQGLLIVGVPDFDSPARKLFGTRWSGLQLPFHRHHFTAGTLKATMGAAGFQVDRLRYRSVGTLYSSLTAERHLPGYASSALWLGLLALDDVLDLAGRGDTLEATARPL
jgi:2-polyprenyl-3-methyl-5-hydroxy-6-metoxy-1,4-benzoquinol methylase